MHSQIKVVDNKIENIERFLNSKLPLDTLRKFFELNSNRLNRHYFNVKGKLINKLNKINRLQNEVFNNFLNIDKSKWIINLSNSKIPDNINSMLSLGDKFALPINIKDHDDCRDAALGIIKNFETSSYKFPENSLDNLRTIMVKLIEKHLSNNKHIKYFDSYLLKQFSLCKKFLKENDELFVTKADKGQVTVIIEKQTYLNRMNMTLDDNSTYKRIKKDPLNSITNKTNKMLKLWADNKIIDEPTYKGLRCTNGNLPRCYGLPKIHKEGFPLRIVVSSIGSPTYDMARYLHEILNSSIKKPASNIKDSWSFVKKINKIMIDSDEILISLDATSLFTNIPKELVMSGIRGRWNDIKNATKMSLTQFLDAIELVLSSTCFKFDGKFYEQTYGSPMGSPLSPILADIIMEDLEIKCLADLDFEIRS